MDAALMDAKQPEEIPMAAILEAAVISTKTNVLAYYTVSVI
jgi:hypothetical protein